jgi:probable HAF family extracellular repeat protein
MMRARRPGFKPRMDVLEDRSLPSTYSVTDLGTLGGTYSVAVDINNTSQVQVVGSANTAANAQHAFLWQNGAMADLGTLGGTNSNASTLNNSGQVVGAADIGQVVGGYNVYHAFLWQNGVMTDLGTTPGNLESYADAINNAGQVEVVGRTGALDANGYLAWHAFAWQNSVMTDLNSLLPANSGWVLQESTAVNDGGQIAGYGVHNGHTRAFLDSGGVVTDLGSLTGSTGNSFGFSLDDGAEVVGRSSARNTEGRAFLSSGGIMTNLGALNSGSASFSTAYDVNNSTQVVGGSTFGRSVLGNPNPTHAFVWQSGTMTDLNKLLPKNSPWELADAFGINDTGSIVGNGSVSGQTHAFLAIPTGTALMTTTTASATNLMAPSGGGAGPQLPANSDQALLLGGASAAFAAPVAIFFTGDGENGSNIRVAAKNLDGDKNADLVVGAGSAVTAYLGNNLAAGSATEDYGFDAVPGFTGGVFVG